MPLLLPRNYIPSTTVQTFPDLFCEISFATAPLRRPVWTDVSAYLRTIQIERGRSFEYDRMEAGTAKFVLDNNDSRFNPDNTAGPYYPNVKPARRVALRARFNDIIYHMFLGVVEGYPQTFASGGFDALISQNATDWFWPLSTYKFASDSVFPAELSGARIARCLDTAGLDDPEDRDLDTGQTVIAEMDASGQTALEHCLLIAEAENGRFFVSRNGLVTFRQRHAVLTTELSPRGTFVDAPQWDAGANDEFAYAPTIQLTQDDSKLFNRIRITIPSGATLEADDTASVEEYFERVFQRDWPIDSQVEAQDAATYVLQRLKDPMTRIPAITIEPQLDPARLFPVVLGLELGQRWRFQLTPPGGGTIFDSHVIVDGISHAVGPKRWATTLRFVPADEHTYWILQNNTYGILNQTTRLAY